MGKIWSPDHKFWSPTLEEALKQPSKHSDRRIKVPVL